MLFPIVVLLMLLVSVIAHPHVHPHPPKHGRRHQPSGGENVVEPIGGLHDVSNNSSEYGSMGSGFANDTAAPATLEAESAVDDIQQPPSNVSGCDAGSRPTVTVYETDLVTMTLTAEESVAGPTDTSILAGSSNTTVPAGVIAEDASAKPSEGTPTPEQASIDEIDDVDSDFDSSDETTAAASGQPVPPERESGKFETNNETTKASVADSESPSSSTSVEHQGAFYEVASRETTKPAPPPPQGSVPGGKRGLAYNSAKLTNAFAGTPMSWAYNWAGDPSGDLDPSVEFVPMLWGPKTFPGWKATAESSVDSGATHMLSFNEPDMAAQANMDTVAAAAAHIKHMNPYAGKVRIGSPAVTNGGPDGGTDGLGLSWMKRFLDNCAGRCKLDFLAFHWYDSASNVDYFKKHVQEVIDLGKEHGIDKVWLTEFGAAGSDKEIAKFLDEVLPWMDSNDAVERYAYFMCAEGQLVRGGAVSDPVGKVYSA